MNDETGIVNVINKFLTRRRVLRRFAESVSALVVGVVAPNRALACQFGCCNLCIEEPHGFDNKNCDCIWGWKCPDSAGINKTCYYYQCEECIKPPKNGCTEELCWQWNQGNPCAWFCQDVGVIGSRATQTITKVPGCTPP